MYLSHIYVIQINSHQGSDFTQNLLRITPKVYIFEKIHISAFQKYIHLLGQCQRDLSYFAVYLVRVTQLCLALYSQTGMLHHILASIIHESMCAI